MDLTFLLSHQDDLVKTLAIWNMGLVGALALSWVAFGIILGKLWNHHVRIVEKFTDVMMAAKEFMARVR